MALKKLQRPDGTIVELDAPEDATLEDLVRLDQKQQKLEEYYRLRFAEPEEGPGLVDTLQEIPKGLASGALGFAESAALGAITPQGEEGELESREAIKGFFDPMQEYLAADKGLEDSVTRGLSSAVGSMGAMVGAAAIPGVGVPLAIGSGVAAGAGEASERARAAGASEEDRGLASLQGAGVGALEYIPVFKIFNRAKKLGLNNVDSLVTRVKNMGYAGLEEAAQEGLSQTLQNAIEKAYNEDRELFDGTLESSGYGAGAGGLMQAVVDYVAARRIKGQKAADDAAAAAEAEANLPPGGLGAESQFDMFGDELTQARTELEEAQRRDAENAKPTNIDDTESTLNREATEENAPSQIDIDSYIEEVLAKEEAQRQEQKKQSELQERQRQIDEAYAQREASDVVDPVQEEMDRAEAPAEYQNAVLQKARAEQEAAAQERIPDELRAATPQNAAMADALRQAKAKEQAGIDPQQDAFPIEKADAALRGAKQPEAPAAEEPQLPPEQKYRAEDPESKQYKLFDKQGRPTQLAKTGPATPPVKPAAKPTPPTEVAAAQGEADAKPIQPDQRGTGDGARVSGRDQPAAGVRGRGDAGVQRAGQPVESVRPGMVNTQPAVQPDTVGQGAQPAPLTQQPAATPQQPAATPQQPAATPQQPAATTQGKGKGKPTAADAGTRKAIFERIKQEKLAKVGIQPAAKPAPTKKAKAKAKPVEEVTDAQEEPIIDEAPQPEKTGRGSSQKPSAKPVEEQKAETGERTEPTKAKQPKQEKSTGRAERTKRDAGAEKDTEVAVESRKRKSAPKGYTAPEFVRKQRKINEVDAAVSPTDEPGLRKSEVKAEKGTNQKTRDRIDSRKEELGTLRTAVEHDYTKDVGADIATNTDNDTVAELLDNAKVQEVESKKKQAQQFDVTPRYAKFFAITDNITSALHDIAYAKVFGIGSTAKPDPTDTVAKYFHNLTEDVADQAITWVENNLSKSANKRLEEFLQYWRTADAEMRDADRDRSIISKTRAEEQEAKEAAIKAEKDSAMSKWKRGDLNSSEVLDAVVYMPLHPMVRAQLEAGDIVAAVDVLANTAPHAEMRKLFRSMIDAFRKHPEVKPPKVEIVDNLYNDKGQRISGKLSRETNTIMLDREYGMNGHIIGHEVTHALTHFVIDNAGHPITKQLNALYKQVKKVVPDAYGAENLHEFVAEAFSNPDFRYDLAKIPTDVKGYTIWNKMAVIMRNVWNWFTGKPYTTLEKVYGATNARNQADILIKAILAPQASYRDTGDLYSAAVYGDKAPLVEAIRKTINNTDYASGLQKFTSWVGSNITPSLREFGLGVLHVGALADLSKKYFPTSGTIRELFDKKDGALHKMQDESHALIDKYREWRSASGKGELIDDVIAESTFEQVDPSKPRSAYEKDVEKAAVWDKLHAKDGAWTKLGPEGQAMYNQLRNFYAQRYDTMMSALQERLGDKYDAFIKKFFAKGRIEPFFPLTREGNHWASFNMKMKGEDGVGERVDMAFESPELREQTLAAFMEDPEIEITGEIDRYIQVPSRKMEGAPPDDFVQKVLELLEVKGQGADAQTKDALDTITEQVSRLYIDMMPDRSYLRALKQRKNKLGFRMNSLEALIDRAPAINRNVANIQYNKQLNDAYTQLEEEFKNPENGMRDDKTAAALMDEWGKRVAFSKNPFVSPWARRTTTIAFGMTLGFNVSSAVVNMTHVPAVVMPYLMGKYKMSLDELTQAVSFATKAYHYGGKTRKIKVVGSEILGKDENGNPIYSEEVVEEQDLWSSLQSIDFDDPNLPAEYKQLKQLVDVAGRRGQLSRSFVQDAVENIDERSIFARINNATGMLFHHSERFIRQTTLAASYKAQIEAFKKKEGRDPTEAELETMAEQALYDMEETNGNANAAAAPRFAQSGLGKVIMLYKRFGVLMYWMLGKMAKESFNNDPEVAKIAQRQLAGTFAATGLMAGVSGLPLYGMFQMVHDLLMDDEDEDFDSVMRGVLQEPMYGGLLNYITGMDFSTRIGLTDLIYRENRINSERSHIMSFIEQLGGPALSLALGVERGVNYLNQGEIQKGFETMAPAAARNVMKAIRYAGEEGSVQTLRGDEIVALNAASVLGQVAGFAPAEYTQQLEENATLKRMDKAIADRRTKLPRALYVALRVGDRDTVQEVMGQIIEFNQRYPANMISVKTLKQSLKKHVKTSAEMYHGVTLSPRMRAQLLEHTADWDDSSTLWEDWLTD